MCGGFVASLRLAAHPNAAILDHMLSKRFFDVAVVFLFAPFWVPALGIIALCTRFALGGPVLFKQTRPGKNGQPFQIVKFRTMSDARDPSGDLLPDEARLNAFGKFLRASSL